MTDLSPLIAFRHALHRQPELSGQEEQTAARVAQALRALSPDHQITGLGGHGVAAVFQGRAPGPTVMLRAELDALPIPETSGVGHASRVPGRGHLCGHDGHMAILLGVAVALAQARPAAGRVVLMFQPAEEDGSGAAAVLADPAFAPLRPDWAFALHNMPGLPLGLAQVSAGPANCASVGVRLRFLGRTAHAATPQTGVSPLPALQALIPAVQALGPGGDLGPDFRLVTLTHLRMGEPSFGIAPGEAEIYLTLRCLLDDPMAALKAQVVALAEAAADQAGLVLTLSWHDDFAACRNDPQAVAQITAALRATGIAFGPASPMRASEDFGRFGQPGTASAMVLLGAGEGHPALHDPRYDFPDALIGVGRDVFLAILRNLLG
ncbi:amidohydrolase [Pseudotabrizicola sp. L79]|uniref:amidohydrolase n=1 Tax=Pseudotabrizicola sp. L79 TaxID=3118402 RepID=UPI002F9570BB